MIRAAVLLSCVTYFLICDKHSVTLRKVRIDAPGASNHTTYRGVERRKIFLNGRWVNGNGKEVMNG